MGFRFRRSVRLLPGVRLNFGTRGVSTSVGGRGFTLNFGKRGIRTTVGLPGTGISYSEMLTRNSTEPSSGGTDPRVGSSFGWKTWAFILLSVVFLTRVLGGPEPDRSYAVATAAPAAATAAALPAAVVIAKSLKCRAAPHQQARVLRQWSRNTVVEKLEERQGWVRVTQGHATGPAVAAESCWVAQRFLRDVAGT